MKPFSRIGLFSALVLGVALSACNCSISLSELNPEDELLLNPDGTDTLPDGEDKDKDRNGGGGGGGGGSGRFPGGGGGGGGNDGGDGEDEDEEKPVLPPPPPTASFKVSFNKNGGQTDANPSTKTVERPATTVDELPQPPTWESRRFDGWNTAKDGSGTAFDEKTRVNADVTVYAQWDRTHFTVTFNSNGGAPTPPAVEVERGKFLDPWPNEPGREHHKFLCWSETRTGGVCFDAKTPILSDKTLYAQWTKTHCTVTFHSNGGAPTPSPVTVLCNTSLGAYFPASPPERTHFAFVRWNMPNGNEFTATTPVPADMTVTAQWNQTHCTVTFNSNGGAPTPSPVTVLCNTSLGAYFPAPPPERTHFAFVRWNMPNGNEFTATTPVPANMTVTAQWHQTHCTVTFHSNGGAPTPSPVVVLCNTSLGAHFPAPPERTHFEFVRWDMPNGSEFTATTPVPANMTVYAKWEQTHFVVTFHGNNGTLEFTSSVVERGKTIDRFPTATRDRHRLTGWVANGSPFTLDTPVNAALTVVAQWVQSTFTVTFDKNEGDTEADPSTITIVWPKETINPLPKPPERERFKFVEWNAQKDGSGEKFNEQTLVTFDRTVHAQWEQTHFTVTFDSTEGEPTPAPVTVPKGEALGSRFPADPTSEYDFEGWRTEKNGGGIPFTDETPVNADMTVYAQWFIFK